ncbi:P-loop NTPase [Paenarthrobacter sp. YIM B13468]|uniref:P-loop NTPase n=1 Tax=Paenarthrobacter sp. YIM B13468 TaxID=3366295 RepID=UPI0036727BD3
MSNSFTDIFFGELDVLVVDMPAGTGDVSISVGQALPHGEVIVVMTPQSAASGVAIRSGSLARQLNQRVVGVVESVSGMHLDDGGHFEPFGAGGGAGVASKLSATGETVGLLASIPFSTALRVCGDAGIPVVIAEPEDKEALAFVDLAKKLSVRPRCLAGLPLSVSARD